MDGPNGCHADLDSFQLSHTHWDSQEREITCVERIEYVSECYTQQIQAHITRALHIQAYRAKGSSAIRTLKEPSQKKKV